MRRDAMRCDARTKCTKQVDAVDKDALRRIWSGRSLRNEQSAFASNRAIDAQTMSHWSCLRAMALQAIHSFLLIFTTRSSILTELFSYASRTFFIFIRIPGTRLLSGINFKIIEIHHHMNIVYL